MPGLKQEPARILYYVPCLTAGGVEKNVRDLALALPRDRFDPVVVWSCYWGPLGEDLQDAGIPVHRVALNEPRRLSEVVSVIRDLRPRLFHSFSYRQDDSDVRAALEAGVCTIITNRPDVRFWDEPPILQEWEIFRNRGTQAITVCSQAIASMVRHVESVPEEKIRLIYNGVKMPARERVAASIREELAIRAGDPLLGYVANYRPEKGHETLLRAFRQVLDFYPSARLICCGVNVDGVKERLDRLVEELGLNGNVDLLDFQADVDRIYRGLDIYVHPSDTEGFSNALLEGMSHGKPVVATRVGGNEEALGGSEAGLLVPAREPASLAMAIVTLLGDPGLAARLGKTARDRIGKYFQFEDMLSGYINLYEEELAKQ